MWKVRSRVQILVKMNNFSLKYINRRTYTGTVFNISMYNKKKVSTTECKAAKTGVRNKNQNVETLRPQ